MSWVPVNICFHLQLSTMHQRLVSDFGSVS
jgi:hypothetical protein